MYRNLYSKCLVLCSLCLLIITKVSAQVANYTFSQSLIANAYTEINSSNALNFTIWQSGSQINTNAYSSGIPITYNGLPG
jgi:hypothetical protein